MGTAKPEVVLENPWLRLGYNLEGRGLSLVYKEKAGIGVEGGHFVVEADGTYLSTHGCPADATSVDVFEDEMGAGQELTVHSTLGSLSIMIRIRLHNQRPTATIEVALKNEGNSPVRIGKVRVLDVSSAGGALRLGQDMDSAKVFLESNNLCWTGVKSIGQMEVGEPHYLDDIPDELKGELSSASRQTDGKHQSGGVGVIYNPTAGISFLAGFLTVNLALGKIVTVYSPEEGITDWWAENLYDGLELGPGDVLHTERLCLDFRHDPLEGLEVYGDMLARINHIPPIPRSQTPMLWCSWYSHRLTITEQAVLEHARIIADRFKDYGVDLLQIDYGWNWRDTPGEWRPHAERFPHGIKWLSERLEEMGLKLGLWLAPFYIGEQSSFYKEHPECLLKNPATEKFVQNRWAWESQPKDTWQNVALLNTTCPESQRWLREIFKEMSSWGVNYFKLDFLNGGSTAPLAFAEPGAENAYRVRDGEQMRIGLSAIREAVGQDAYLLGGNLPISHGLGLLSAIFGAMDVGNATGNFDHLRSRMTTIISRYWQQKRLWHVDPDVLYLGGEFLKPGDICSVGEARIRTTAVALSGGPVLLGDDLTTLPEERLKMYPLCLPPYGAAARPVDLFKNPYPNVWDLEVETDWDRWHVVGLFNYEAQDRTIEVDFRDLKLDPEREYLVWEFWDQEFLGRHRGKIGVKVPGQTAKVLAIREFNNHPCVLSTSFHLTQGGVELSQVRWDEELALLSGVCRRVKGAKGHIFIYLPSPYKPKNQRNIEMVTPQIARLELSFPSPEIQWQMGPISL